MGMKKTSKRNPNLEVTVAGIRMRNPVMVASGTFGYGSEYSDIVDLECLGAVVVKGISAKPWPGNRTPRLVEVSSGIVNAIGLQNPGAAKFASDYMPFLRRYDVPVIVNIWGRSEHEYVEVAERISDVAGVRGLEVNVSCPNIKEGGIAFGTDPRMLRRVVSAVRKCTRLPVIPKLSPNVSNISLFARVAEDSGADAISLVNSIPAMVIDIDSRRPVLANITGGLSGPCIHPIAVKLVWEAAKAVKIPVIGMGGISTVNDALEFIIAGATAVAVGTANFRDPRTALAIISGIKSYLSHQGLKGARDLIGTIRS
jgi:dihydroorotate dehydrogenase (NAD+) catalytic subunit